MSDPNLNESVQAIIRQVARDVVLPHYQNLKTSDIQEKSPSDLVTVADKLSEEMLSEKLSALTPGAAIVGEEASAADPSVMDHLADNQTWIIDPIDGTGNFAAGNPPFGMIVALSEANETVAGWLYDPLADRMCYAAKGQGAFLNGERLVVPDDPEGNPIAAMATGFMTSEQRGKLLAAADGHYQIVDIPRCAAEQYPRLALGSNHISTFERSLPWDHAAGILFLNEAGGKAARWNGDAYRPADRKTGLLGASSPKLWDEAAELLGSVFSN
ncbi:inositol monophosphatase family protein [Parasphingorhabdus cellanae]|uniref:Inositol monophosphatase n=1 Tax=Parasphingorhabdus cellanae TaxID=2806553 RepID=A0ABX7T5B4_9SPHN|nr:inositol monophosphatase family protein [Parasphingorhabdus cellanae]QTD56118.1 inositol monophosphatase [Parasphingorhabdus cellanae]